MNKLYSSNPYCQTCKSPDALMKISVSKTGRQQHLCRKCETKRQGRYRNTPNGRIAESEASRRAYKKHKEKWVTRAKLRYAVKTGMLKKPNKCEVCNKAKKLQGHHEDYSLPLEVIWLCSACHADADKALNEN